MEIEELLDYLEIASPDEFEYFEHLADLIECDQHIPYDAFYQVLSRISSAQLVEITDNYFEDIQSGLPDECVDFYTLLDTIKQALIGLAQNVTTENNRILYVDELYRFRDWYHFDSTVHCVNLKNQIPKEATISEALILSRLEKLNEDEYTYDFSDCLEYEVNEYVLSFSATIDVNEHNDDDEDHPHSHLIDDMDPYEDGLIDHDHPVIDQENEEEDYEKWDQI